MSNYTRTLRRRQQRMKKASPPKHIPVGHIEKPKRNQLQKQRDLALVQAKVQYEARLRQINDSYWKAVQAA